MLGGCCLMERYGGACQQCHMLACPDLHRWVVMATGTDTISGNRAQPA
jgi:hypothetical protein